MASAKLNRHWPCILVLATAALAQPASAAAAGTWTSQDLTRLALRWRVDDGKGAVSTAFKLTQPVVRVFNGATGAELHSFFAFGPSFTAAYSSAPPASRVRGSDRGRSG